MVRVLKTTVHACSLTNMFSLQFFWNDHLLNPFVLAGQSQYCLPIMQGFVSQSPFQAPIESGTMRNFLLTLISRRSINRAGLRYLRRGVDEDGHVANCVETEQLLSDVDGGTSLSFVQIRGSIPVFFQQSPYALKPKPVLMHTSEALALFAFGFSVFMVALGVTAAVMHRRLLRWICGDNIFVRRWPSLERRQH